MLFRSWSLTGQGVARVLGPLETQVMDVVWSHSGPMSTRDIHDAMHPPRRRTRTSDRAFTTIVTTVERLYKKKMLRRSGRKGEYMYAAAVTREEFTEHLVTRVMGHLLQDFAEPTLSYLSQRIDPAQEDEYDGLASEIDRRRRRKEET